MKRMRLEDGSVLIVKLLHREQKHLFTITDRTTMKCVVKSLTELEADQYRDRGYWVE